MKTQVISQSMCKQHYFLYDFFGFRRRQFLYILPSIFQDGLPALLQILCHPFSGMVSMHCYIEPASMFRDVLHALLQTFCKHAPTRCSPCICANILHPCSRTFSMRCCKDSASMSQDVPHELLQGFLHPCSRFWMARITSLAYSKSNKPSKK